MKREFKSINCVYCKEAFVPTCGSQKACTVCRKHVESIDSQVKNSIDRYRRYGSYLPDVIDPRINDHTGKTFSRWTVVEQDMDYSGKGARWICKCECGTIKSVSGASLIHSASKSCGCLKVDMAKLTHRLPKREASFNRVFGAYRSRAKSKGQAFEFDKDSFRAITSEPCYYCGSEPSAISKSHKSYGGYVHNGVDRYDNTKGYTLSNSVPCCATCNRAKLAMTADAFLSLCNKISNKWEGKEI